MIDDKIYRIDKNENCLLEIYIHHSFNIDYKFWLCKKDKQYYVFWCKFWECRELIDVLRTYPMKTRFEDLPNDDEFIKYFNSKITYNKVILDEKQTKLFEQLYNSDLDNNVNKPHGLDGYSYYINIYKDNSIKRYDCWCNIPYQWNILKQISKELFEMADMDKEYFD